MAVRAQLEETTVIVAIAGMPTERTATTTICSNAWAAAVTAFSPLGKRRPRHPRPETSQGGVREAAVSKMSPEAVEAGGALKSLLSSVSIFFFSIF
jgi:hypothetical protein